MGKLTALHINLIGAGAALVLALILFFVLIKPKNEEVEKTKGEVTSTQSSGGTPDQVKGQERELADTKLKVAKTQADWAVNEAQYMPNIITFGTTPDLLHTYEHRVITWPEIFGTKLASWYDAQRDEGVARLPGVEFPIDSFPTDPNAISQLTYLKFPRDRWQVQMEAKNFDAAMAHLAKFNSMHQLGMPVINNVALQGTSPSLIMTYDLALYIIPRQPPPQGDPRLSGQAGAGGAQGGGGSPGGGAPIGGSQAASRGAPSTITSPATGAGGSGKMGGREE